MSNIVFNAPPTCAEFMRSDSFMRVIGGPVGSGKTTACIFELFRRSCEQLPAPDGFRYTRWAIVRQTLAQLKSTVLKDITAWLEGIADFRVSESTIHIRVGDVISEWILIPLDNPEDQRRLLSSQLTGAWMSECIEMDASLVPALAGRCNRFPSANRGVCSWAGIIADTNMPSEGSDWHELMTNVPPDWQVFIQPGGMDPEAENLDWLSQTPETIKLPLGDPKRRAQGRTYYERLARSSNPDWVKRYVHAQFGDDPSGTAVFRDTFKRNFHVVDELEPVHGHPLLVGQDFGRDPCAVICQLDHRGRLLVLEEIICEDMGLELAIQTKIRPALAQVRYLGRAMCFIGDPAGVAKNNIYEETSFDCLKKNGFKAFPAPTNDIDPRIRAIESFLLQQRDGGACLLIDRARCPTIVRALDGGYRYEKTKAGERKPNPAKNKYSHPIDALQYAALGATGGMPNMVARQMRRNVHSMQRVIPTGGWT